MKNKISEFYIKVVPLNKKRGYRITRRVLRSIHEAAKKDSKLALLQIVLNDDSVVNVEFEFHKNRGYIKDYHPQNSILINESVFSDLAQDMESNIIYELIDDDDGIWRLSISFQRRL